MSEGWGQRGGAPVCGDSQGHVLYCTVPFLGSSTDLSGHVQALTACPHTWTLSLEMTSARMDLLQTGFMKVFMNFSM